MYDDRILQMLRLIAPDLDIRELVVQKYSTEPSHVGDSRLSPDEIEDACELDELVLSPEPRLIAVVDDVLTTGAHFRAMKEVLQGQMPSVDVVGLFIARRVPGATDVEVLAA